MVPVTRATLDFLATLPILVYIILWPQLADALKFCRIEWLAVLPIGQYVTCTNVSLPHSFTAQSPDSRSVWLVDLLEILNKLIFAMVDWTHLYYTQKKFTSIRVTGKFFKGQIQNGRLKNLFGLITSTFFKLSLQSQCQIVCFWGQGCQIWRQNIRKTSNKQSAAF